MSNAIFLHPDCALLGLTALSRSCSSPFSLIELARTLMVIISTKADNEVVLPSLSSSSLDCVEIPKDMEPRLGSAVKCLAVRSLQWITANSFPIRGMAACSPSKNPTGDHSQLASSFE